MACFLISRAELCIFVERIIIYYLFTVVNGVCVRHPVPDRGARPITGEKTASTKADWTKLLIKQSETSPDHMAATFMGLASERQRSGINSAFFFVESSLIVDNIGMLESE